MVLVVFAREHSYAKHGHHDSELLECRQSLLLLIINVLLSLVNGSLFDHSLGICRHSVTTGEAEFVIVIGSCQV